LGYKAFFKLEIRPFAKCNIKIVKSTIQSAFWQSKNIPFGDSFAGGIPFARDRLSAVTEDLRVGKKASGED
jgi:hypothetical protein